MAPIDSVIVVGAGVFGLAAGLALLQDGCTQVVLVDDGDPQAASVDTHKIIRDDYASLQRMQQAMEAHSRWRTDPFFSKYYRPSGRLVVYHPSAVARFHDCNQTRLELGLETRVFLSDKHVDAYLQNSSPGTKDLAAMELARGIFSRVSSDIRLCFNKDDGVVEWDRLMSDMKSKFEQLGGTLINSKAEKISSSDAHATAVVLSKGKSLDARNSTIVLSAGAWSMGILKASDLSHPPHHRLPISTGVFAFYIKLNADQRRMLHNTPCFSVYGLEIELADGGEYLPPLSQAGLAKIGWTLPFISNAPQNVSQSILAAKALLQSRKWADDYCPALRGAEVVDIRSPWDGTTPSQSPIIARHPDASNLVLATAGSYNHAKDAPIMGERIRNFVYGREDNQVPWAVSGAESVQNQAHLVTQKTFEAIENELAADALLLKVREELRSRPLYI